ncbi:hypothetical protein [Corynebacterium flavescens]|uniref:hypothetical protein n=1 Tax=Corynebacterium flavescens TaxID=28028 RepID=UPI003FD6311E
MVKQTKAERIEEKVAGGLSHIEAEIEVEQEDAAARIARLRQRQEKEDAKVREIVVDLLEEEHSDVFEHLQAKARERAKRATRSSEPTPPSGGVAAQSAFSTET